MLYLIFLSFYVFVIFFFISVILEWNTVSFLLLISIIFWIIVIPYVAIFYDAKHVKK